jgi:hypothetical protein
LGCGGTCEVRENTLRFVLARAGYTCRSQIPCSSVVASKKGRRETLQPEPATQPLTPGRRAPPPPTNTPPLRSCALPRRRSFYFLLEPSPPPSPSPEPPPFLPSPFSAARPSESRKTPSHGAGARRRSGGRFLQGMTR